MSGSITDKWQRLSGLPGGRRLFSVLIGRYARYSGSIGARVEELSPGRSRVTLRDRAKVRNHLRSVHATALVTLGEMASGLAMMAAMPPKTRAIVTGLDIEYLKKARGPLTAHGAAPTPEGDQRREYVASASIRDAADREVARMRVRWLVGPEDAG